MSETLTRDQKRTALNLFRMDDFSDPWGTGMTHMFAVADILYHANADLAPRWQFKHGAFDHDPVASYTEHMAKPDHARCDCVWPDTEYIPFLDAGETGIAMLTYAGKVFDRYLNFVRRAGLDY